MLCAFLMMFGADPSVKCKDGKTAADLARERGHVCPLKIIESSPEEVANVRDFVFTHKIESLLQPMRLNRASFRFDCSLAASHQGHTGAARIHPELRGELSAGWRLPGDVQLGRCAGRAGPHLARRQHRH